MGLNIVFDFVYFFDSTCICHVSNCFQWKATTSYDRCCWSKGKHL